MAKKQEIDARHYDVILGPHITEKSTMASEHNAVVFKIAGDATKPQVKEAVEALFDVTVTGSNDGPVLAVAPLGTINDTPASDSFADLVGTIASSDVDVDAAPAYSLTGGIVTGELGYDFEQTGTYGTLYLNAVTGDYRYVVNTAAVESLTVADSEAFSITVQS